ncbi:hypothetical protein K2173_021998 [Erythroxylum novogranatense]|uniref:Uncharacterized protein n=1 Tax=Erythroxylum novogranatense TaxID=1862640 RepID=A0AAV8T2G4_9ROSI|nr:hypothetical protein K2173_021998 [Erythroxylum novogranatense]
MEGTGFERATMVLLVVSTMLLLFASAQTSFPPIAPQTPNSPIIPPPAQEVPQLPIPIPTTPEEPRLPPQFPLSPPEIPIILPPPAPDCDTKCAEKCMLKKFNFLKFICMTLCKATCRYSPFDSRYRCIAGCAHSLPHALTTDEIQVESYMNYCSKRCESAD